MHWEDLEGSVGEGGEGGSGWGTHVNPWLIQCMTKPTLKKKKSFPQRSVQRNREKQ